MIRREGKARENFSWELIQDMIDKEISSAFKLRPIPAPCSRTALVHDRYMDEIKLEMNGGKYLKKVDDKVWDKIVQRMKDKR